MNLHDGSAASPVGALARRAITRADATIQSLRAFMRIVVSRRLYFPSPLRNAPRAQGLI